MTGEIKNEFAANQFHAVLFTVRVPGTGVADAVAPVSATPEGLLNVTLTRSFETTVYVPLLAEWLKLLMTYLLPTRELALSNPDCSTATLYLVLPPEAAATALRLITACGAVRAVPHVPPGPLSMADAGNGTVPAPKPHTRFANTW